ncbi:2OG-Fe(II) oxygenase family oxidoreductase [Rhizoctonia solani AG-3 Rhs1AP]|uniref:2OG-Fe(II) oxygenase family oxidoreductase n=1 Tax=Rhizoctonia solani AG-3 Rhs1AP TaxID=1086054 RepID=X8JQF8_9AGAM|nr:2OG-Fe(II) oxygenase family oxidoreductase [Rhizoctonia solani AG-3 Rhs1AP]
MIVPTLRSSLRAQLPRAARFGLRTRTLATDPNFTIPVIDFSKFRRSQSLTEKETTANEIVSAFERVGFIYLSQHGIPTETVENAFKQSAAFFKLPMDVKAKLAWEDPRSNRGYVMPGRERVTQSADPAEIARLRALAPDSKESMEIGRDWDATWSNMWPNPKDAPHFKDTFLSFFQASHSNERRWTTCHELHAEVMSSIALGLGLGEQYFDKLIHEQYHNLRLLSYPPISRDALLKDGQARAGAHSDYGTLTLLFQDQVGGLEVQNPHTKQFQPATPIPGTIVVNVGDLLARWSNDRLRSTLHRVVAPPIGTGPMTPARQSIAFFCNPNGGAEIACLPNTGKAKYPPVKTEQYIVGRLKATYA